MYRVSFRRFATAAAAAAATSANAAGSSAGSNTTSTTAAGEAYRKAFDLFVRDWSQLSEHRADCILNAMQLRAEFAALLNARDRPHMGQVWFGLSHAIATQQKATGNAGMMENQLLQVLVEDRKLICDLVASVCRDVNEKRITPASATSILREAMTQLHFVQAQEIAKRRAENSVSSPSSGPSQKRRRAAIEEGIDFERDLQTLNENERMLVATLATMKATETNSVREACNALVDIQTVLRTQQEELWSIQHPLSRDAVKKPDVVVPPLHYTEWGCVLNLLPKAPPDEVDAFKECLRRLEGTKESEGRYSLSAAQRANFVVRVVVPHCVLQVVLIPSRMSPAALNGAKLVLLLCALLVLQHFATKYSHTLWWLLSFFSHGHGSSASHDGDHKHGTDDGKKGSAPAPAEVTGGAAAAVGAPASAPISVSSASLKALAAAAGADDAK